MSPDLRDLRDPTRPSADAVQRVRDRLGEEIDPRTLRALLRTVPGARPGAEDRVRARLAASPTRRRPAVGPALWLPVAVAIAGLVAAGIGFSLRRDAPIPLDTPLSHDAVAVGGLTLSPQGIGTLEGTSHTPTIGWEAGSLAVDVDPDAGIDLDVRTREASVRVTGTAFDVVRDALGTRVDLHRGSVVVTCAIDDAPRPLAPGDTITCPPVSADGMLGRVRGLARDGTGHDALIDEIDAGLEREEGSPEARVELGVLRISSLARSEARAEALADARVWLDAGHTLRRPDVLRIAASLALDLEGCPGAEPHLDALASTDLQAALALARCTPERARDVLDAADRLAGTPDERASLRRARTQLLGDPR